MRSTLFTIFGLPIRSYGVMMVVGFAFAMWRAMRVSKKLYAIDPERVYDIALVALFGGVLGARACYVAMDPHTQWRSFFAVWEGGLSFHGGLICALVFGYIYTRLAKLSFWKCADLVAPSIALAYGFARIGCFLNGCCYGIPTSLPWGVRFYEDGQWTPPSHPTQIYASITSFVIFWILTRLERPSTSSGCSTRKPGFLFISYLGLYSIYRFLIEFLREGQIWAYHLTVAQVVSLAVLGLSVIVILTVYRGGQKSTES